MGGWSYFIYDWKVGYIYQFKVNVKLDVNESDKVVFMGWFCILELNIW